MRSYPAEDFRAYDEVKADSCIGKFFKEGISTSVSTTRENVKYGFQFWVYDVGGESTITMTGHGGLFNVRLKPTDFIR